MPANHQIDNNKQLIITTWEGDAHDNEFIEAIKTYQKDIQNIPDYINYNEVVDLSKVTSFKLTTDGIINIGKIASSTDRNETVKKLALIVNSRLAYGLCRMYETYRSFSKKSNKVIRVFKNKKDALEWIEK